MGEKSRQPERENGLAPAAVIDIGSNTTRLLVAQKRGAGFRPLLSHRVYNRLGRDLEPDGAISAPQIEALAATLSTQLELAGVLGAGSVKAMATAAIRDASNSEELTKRVKQQTGLKVKVLGEDEEARLAFLGATHALPSSEGATIAVIDVGGGSTEVAVGSLEDGVRWSTSFRIGSGLLTDRFIAEDPPAVVELDAVRESVERTFSDFNFPEIEQAIAIGGTASSLRRLVGNVLEHETLERAIRLITQYDTETVAEEFALDPERVQVLPAGVMILEVLGDRLGQPLKIGKGGLREGKLLELLA